jgi:Fe2+ or Zn2+ uptake regulation protein
VNETSAGRILEQAGIEATPIRRAVLAAMAGEDRAVSALEILHAVRRAGPVNKVTVYRTLDLFVDRGVALRHAWRALPALLPGRGPRLGLSCHAWCRRCGRMECMPEAVKELGVAAFVESLDMDVEGVEIRIDGVCRRVAGPGRAHSPRPSPRPPAGLDRSRSRNYLIPFAPRARSPASAETPR